MKVLFKVIFSLTILFPAYNSAGESDASSYQTVWMTGEELNDVREKMSEQKKLPGNIEVRNNNGALQYKGKFIPYPSGLTYYHSFWGMSHSWYRYRNTKYSSNGYHLLFHNEFINTDGNAVYQATWVLKDRSSRSILEIVEDFIHDINKRLTADEVPDEIVRLTDSNIKKIIDTTPGYLLIHFSSYDPGCGYCAKSNSYINEIANKYKGKLTVARITWEPWDSYKIQSKALTEQFEVVGIPKFYLYHDGIELWDSTGMTSENTDKLKEQLQACCQLSENQKRSWDCCAPIEHLWQTVRGMHFDVPVIGMLVLIGVGGYVLYLKVNSPPLDMSDPNKILNEVEVLIAYGREKKAISILEKAILRHGNNHTIREKLKDLKYGAS